MKKNKGTCTGKWKRTKGHVQVNEKEQKDMYRQMKKNKRTNGDLQNTTQKNRDWATWTPLITGGESGEGLAVLVPLDFEIHLSLLPNSLVLNLIICLGK